MEECKYDRGNIDLEQRTLHSVDNPFGPRGVTHVLGAFRYLSGRARCKNGAGCRTGTDGQQAQENKDFFRSNSYDWYARM